MNNQDILRLAAQKAKGKRPFFLDSKETEKLLSMTMSLAMELSVTKERLHSLECLLQEKGILSAHAIDNYEPNQEEQVKRSEAQQALISRLFRLSQQDIEALDD